MDDVQEAQAAVVAEFIASVREIDSTLGVTRAGLDAIKAELIKLSAYEDIFTLVRFPPPDDEDDSNCHVYRVSQDDDGRFALYMQSTCGVVDADPHDHTTWACIAGMIGSELNQFYERTPDGGVSPTDAVMVERGQGVTLFGDGVHSIHIEGESLMFHCYGRALEELVDRTTYDPATKEWKPQAPFEILEARY